MIQVDVLTGEDGFLNVQVSGHADPIVCASVSTLVQSQVRYLQELALQYPKEIKVTINGGEQ